MKAGVIRGLNLFFTCTEVFSSLDGQMFCVKVLSIPKKQTKLMKGTAEMIIMGKATLITDIKVF